MSQTILLRESELDEQYTRMYELAMRIASGYLMSIGVAIQQAERPLHTHVLISVRVRSSTSWTVSWCHKVSVLDTPKSKREVSGLRKNFATDKGRYITKELPKGAGNRYPNATFKVLPLEIRKIAIYYESLLADLRRAAKDNRNMRKALLYCLARGEKAVATCQASVAKVEHAVTLFDVSGDLGLLNTLIGCSEDEQLQEV